MAFTLNEVQQKLLKNLYEQTDPNENMYYGYNWLSDGLSDVPRKDLVKAMRRLRKLELADYRKGLFTEDGEVAGSGFSITVEGQEYCKANAGQLGIDL